MLENQIPSSPMLIKDLGTSYPKATSKFKKRFGIYKCSCGVEFKAQSDNIKNGHTKSCGCYQFESRGKSSITHGLTNHPIFDRWYAMVDRTNNPKCQAYKNYGALGISVCARWLDVANFIEDMYPSFKEGLTLDRIDVYGNYEMSNCRWVEWDIQSANKRLIMSTNKSGYRGVSFCKCTNTWRTQLTINGVHLRLGRYKTALEAAIVYDKYIINNNLPYTLNGVYNP